jgi:Zn-dependent peptidase ImmA (M78 family)
VDLEALAKELLIALNMWRLPVDPIAIAKQEGIELAPGQYGERFDARIKYVRAEKSFIIFYKEASFGPSEGRVRFSLGHELGHYYIPHHRVHLLRGKSHNSVTDFRSRDPFEVQADEFSSALLMPHELYVAKLKEWKVSNCNLADFCRLAEQAFHTSITSTVRRYVDFDWEACSLIMSEAGAVKWAKHSESMKALHMGFVASGLKVPNKTPTGRLWGKLESGPSLDREEGHVDADLWFDNPWRRRVWEESMPLGYTGLVLTFLVPEEED